MTKRLTLLALVIIVALTACNTPPASSDDSAPTAEPATTKIFVTATSIPVTPTPFPTTIIERYTVRNGDTLGLISQRYDISVDELMKLNGLTNPNAIQINQQLKIKIDIPRLAPADRLLPDSEVVYSPAYASFDVAAVANQYNGYLASYREKVEGEMLTGPQIIQLVAERFSVGPRVLLALLEFQGGWVTNSTPSQNQIAYPMGLIDPSRQGLFYQTSWAANHLNEGYYGVLTGRFAAFRFKDRARARIVPTINPGTAAIQTVLAPTANWDTWLTQIGNDGFIDTYRRLFGDPAQYAIEPLIPTGLKQPTLRLPWSDGEMWYYTGGPHAGWGDLAGWAAIDFSPKDVLGSCYASRLWVVAAAPGKVIRSEHGRVMVSLSNNDFQGSGWTLMYMHIATSGRATGGTIVNTGDRIGHPSCEGGVAESSHVHFGRLYNGQWMEPDQVPVNLSGWNVTSSGQEYEGKMARGTESREACNCRDDAKNGIVANNPK